jgi:DNA polymerase elongation subunit (family B)
MLDPIIYGNDPTENVVSVASKFGKIYQYTENSKGVKLEIKSYRPWILADENIDEQFDRMEGENEYKWIQFFSTEKAQKEFSRNYREQTWKPRSLVDAYMLTNGTSYFKGMQRKDVSVLSWDIETNGLVRDDKSMTYLIANTYRKGDVLIRKLFDLNNYAHQKEMLEAWADWVRKMDPSIMLGHNLMCYDIPWLLHCAAKSGAQIRIGRDGSEMQLALYESQFRVDATRNMAYRNAICFGREIVDTMFLMINFDLAKKYSSYGLKKLIAEAGLEQPDRVMVDAGKIWQMWQYRHSEPKKWEAVCAYAERDGDDALALWDLAGDSVFYPSQALPMTFSRVCMSASGGQINAQLVRAYLADGHSIPKASEKKKFRGAISHGFPGIYRNVFALDYASLYPSCIIQYEIYDKVKDPKAYVLYMVNFYRKQRLEFKALAAAGDPYYKALDATAKRQLNSFFGFYAAMSANYNSMDCANKITEMGRQMLNTLIQWGTGKTFYQYYFDTYGEHFDDKKSKA